MKNNEELLSAAFERSELIFKKKSALRKKIVAYVSTFVAIIAITTTFFISRGTNYNSNKTFLSEDVISTGAVENENSIIESSTFEDSNPNICKNNESHLAEETITDEDSSLMIEILSSNGNVNQSESTSFEFEFYEKEDKDNSSENTTTAVDNETNNLDVSSKTHSLAEATSDIDPSVDRSYIPDVSKIVVSLDDTSNTSSGLLQSEAYDPGNHIDTDVWYDPDVFYTANRDEKEFDDATQLINDSQTIIIGTVKSISFEAPPTNEDPMAENVTSDGWRMGTIWTVYTVKIEEVHKGDISSEQDIKIYSFGGIRDQMVGEQLAALGGDRMIPIVDRIDAQIGSRYIFMLTETTHYIPVNSGQSIYLADDMLFTSLYGDISTADIYATF